MHELDSRLANQIVEALRKGIPPQQGTELYSVGQEKLIQGIRKFHLARIGEMGKIRFVSGTFGTGKTHLFRLLRDAVFQEGALLSNVELNRDETPFDKFEKVFSSVVRNISSSETYSAGASTEAAPFGSVLEQALFWLGKGEGYDCSEPEDLSYEEYTNACTTLMENKGMDIDFKKMVQKYWETYLPDTPESVIVDQTRGEILQWFGGEGSIGNYRKTFGVNKLVSRENAKLMLQSLAEFIKMTGHKGLVILFDEAEQTYSTIRKTQLKNAQNNLLSLINNVEELPGLFLIYATTPDFYTDPKYGIVTYPPLTQRVGRPDDHVPRALDVIWNLDTVTMDLAQYQEAGRKILEIYKCAYPEIVEELKDESTIQDRVKELYERHPALASVSFWRVMVSALIAMLDRILEGEDIETEKVYTDVMDRLRED